MTRLPDLQGKRVGILGLARSGLACARALQRAGATPVAFDDKEAALDGAVAAGALRGAVGDVAGLALLVASPGVPLTHPAPHPVIAAARAAGVAVTGDIDLFATSHPELRIAGVTGTNGKSTTSALLHHLLATVGKPVVLGGNIGRPVFDLELPSGEGVAVLELSSYQLDLATALRCKVAVWLNLSPDHLDRHGDLESYIAAKRRIFANQRRGDAAVVGIDDPPSAAVADWLEAQGREVVRIGVGQTVPGGIGVVDGMIMDALEGRPTPEAELRGARSLRGAHNHQNAAAAYAAARCLGLTPARAALGLGNFAGLAHRMEEVARIGRVLFVNDSKATNPESATKSLAAYEDVFWIAGGLAKPGGFHAVLPHLPHVRRAYLIGAAAGEIADTVAGRVPVERCGTLAEAVEQASRDAERSTAKAPVVLLAPACASFDQFKSFEDRGERFRRLVGELEGIPMLFASAGPAEEIGQ